MNNAPADDEYEISLFGPGYGEAVLVHVGAGHWIAVDSCVDPTDASVVPLTYLREIGVDVSTQVKLVVATHWHDDHIRGLSDLFLACSSARFGLPNVFTKSEFIEIALLNQISDPSPLGKATTQIGSILKTLRDRKMQPTYIGSDRLLHSCADVGAAEIYSLSPDDMLTHRFLEIIARNFPMDGAPQCRIGDLTPNALSVVLLIKLTNGSIVLGADLEENPGGAWTRLLNNSQCLGEPATVFKVPHHGSVTGHCDRVWEEMLAENVIAVLTPWNRSTKLPQSTDIERIMSLTQRSFATASPDSIAPTRRSQSITQMTAAMGIKLELGHPRPGQVQLRRKVADPDWTVKLHGTAKELKHLRNWAASKLAR